MFQSLLAKLRMPRTLSSERMTLLPAGMPYMREKRRASAPYLSTNSMGLTTLPLLLLILRPCLSATMDQR